MAGYTATRPPRLRFHAVTVTADARACPHALALKDVRLLSVEAPRLPMRDCDRPADCACRFQHHDDRRAGPRRQDPVWGMAGLQLTRERRSGQGRRQTDVE
jgi:hypothetical protein